MLDVYGTVRIAGHWDEKHAVENADCFLRGTLKSVNLALDEILPAVPALVDAAE